MATFENRRSLPPERVVPGNSARAPARSALDAALESRNPAPGVFGHEGWLARGRQPLSAFQPSGSPPGQAFRPVNGVRTEGPGFGQGAAPMQLPNVAPRPPQAIEGPGMMRPAVMPPGYQPTGAPPALGPMMGGAPQQIGGIMGNIFGQMPIPMNRPQPMTWDRLGYR